MPPEYREVRTAPAAPRDGVVELDVIVDAASVEVFVNRGESTLSSLAYPAADSARLAVEAVGTAGAKAMLRQVSVTPLAVAAIDREG